MLNVRRNPTASYLKVHRASCRSISELQAGYSRWTTGEYAKVCAGRISELEEWAQRETGGMLEDGCYCLTA